MKINYVKIDLKDYEFALINSKIHHELSSSAYNERRKLCESVAKKLGVLNVSEQNETSFLNQRSKLPLNEFTKVNYVVSENERVLSAFQSLGKGEIVEFGTLLNATRFGLQHKYEVSCPEIDFLVDQTRKSGVIVGSRVIGGGFVGCSLNLIHKG